MTGMALAALFMTTESANSHSSDSSSQEKEKMTSGKKRQDFSKDLQNFKA